MINFYGDSQRWFIGTVISSKDPEGLGRIQVRIHGIHSPTEADIPEYALPWAECALPVTEGGTSGLSRIPQLVESAMVYGIFLDGVTSQAPMILGCLNRIERPSLIQQNAEDYNDKRNQVAGGVDDYIPSEIRNQFNDSSSIDQRRLLIMMYLTSKGGFTPKQAAGICGNLERECSSFDPSFSGGCTGSAGEKGIAQWNPLRKAGNRLGKLRQFASNYPGKNAESFFTQLDFILHELRGQQLKGDGGGSFSSVDIALKKCSTHIGGAKSSNATWIFLSKYEIPKNPRSKLEISEGFAIKALTQYEAAISQRVGPQQ